MFQSGPLVCLIGLAGVASLAHGSCTPKLPSFNLTLTPDLSREEGYKIHGEIVVDQIFARNETLVLLPTSIASVPTANYRADDIAAVDQLGDLDLFSHQGDNGPFGLPTRFWSASRQTQGPVTLRFTAHPRQIIDATARAGPHFDVRNGTGGMSGSMWALIPTPDPMSDDRYDVTLSWNVSDQQTAAWTWSDGIGPHSYTFVGPLTRFLQTFWMVGDVTSYTSLPSGNQTADDSTFGMYWLEEPPFDIQEVASFLESLLSYSTIFWQDNTTDPYRVFVRVNKEAGPGTEAAGSGGTALLRSFLFGYNYDVGIPVEGMRELLAHEMTHNWTPWLGGTSAEQSRYNEGAAEYWSLRLLWRAGLISAETFLGGMNTRAAAYYSNPTVNLTDESAMAVAWTRREAQRIPYGRGMLHFCNVDAQLRASSHGERKLDDLAIPFLHICQANGVCGSEDWFALLRDALGEQAVGDWKDISEAKPLVLLDGSLGPCFDVVQETTAPYAYQWQVKQGVDISSPECLI